MRSKESKGKNDIITANSSHEAKIHTQKIPLKVVIFG